MIDLDVYKRLVAAAGLLVAMTLLGQAQASPAKDLTSAFEKQSSAAAHPTASLFATDAATSLGSTNANAKHRKVPVPTATPTPTASQAPVTAAPASSGTSMPVGNLAGWRQTGAQDFTTAAAVGSVGAVYGANVRGYAGFKDTSGDGLYDPDNVMSVSGGVLDYNMHTISGEPRVAASSPFGYTGQTYGMYSVRFKVTAASGYKMAFLLWPSSNNWNQGEIDWPEGNLNGTMSAFNHLPGNPSVDSPDGGFAAPTSATGWHTATIQWTPTAVKWYWDSTFVGQTTSAAAVPKNPMRWTLQAETALNPNIMPAASAVAHVDIDWVVQYAYDPSVTASN